MSVAEFLADWIESEKESVRESTQARQEQLLRLHVYPNIGHLRLGKLNALHVQKLYARKLDEGLSPGWVPEVYQRTSEAEISR
jgi:integrase